MGTHIHHCLFVTQLTEMQIVLDMTVSEFAGKEQEERRRRCCKGGQEGRQPPPQD